MISLSPRLMHIANIIPKGKRVADIGTDHARLVIWLWQNGMADFLIATEISEGPYARASRMIERCGADGNISLRIGDGLEPVAEREADIIIIAGMGGETIADIFEKARKSMRSFAGETFILQPESAFHKLRKYLSLNEFTIMKESLCFERGRIRLFLTVRVGSQDEYRRPDFLYGKALEDDPLFEAYSRVQGKYIEEVIKGIELNGYEDPLLEEYIEGLKFLRKKGKPGTEQRE